MLCLLLHVMCVATDPSSAVRTLYTALESTEPELGNMHCTSVPFVHFSTLTTHKFLCVYMCVLVPYCV